MIQQAEIDKLRSFHASHFPGQRIPNPADPRPDAAEEPNLDQVSHIEEDDGLGYYGDGVKRTLTDEQIKMFRHSEIQQLLNKRRAKRENDKNKEIRQGAADEKRKRRFDDEPERQNKNVDILMYDDSPDQHATSVPTPKKFIWPELG